MAGFGLPEVMISLVIGLILLGGIGVVFLAAKQTFRTQDDFSRIQENVRYALETVGFDVRMAGYSGCVNLAATDPNNHGNTRVFIKANAVPGQLLGDALRGYVGNTWTAPGAAPGNWVPGTGVLHVARVSTEGIRLAGNLTAVNANIQIASNPLGIVREQVLVVSDCQQADVFRAVNVSSGSGRVTIAHSMGSCPSIGAACNVATTTVHNPNALSKAYGADAELFTLVGTTYFIGLNPARNPALYRRTEGGIAEELVENVEDMVMRFGVGTNLAVDGYDAPGAVTDWNRVLTARISLVFRGNNDNVATGNQTSYVVEHATVTLPAADRRLRQVATATFALRNRLP